MSTAVVDFVPARHLEGVVDVLFEVRKKDPAYPPPIDAGFTRESLSAWLMNGEQIANWVAEDDGRVLGYIQVTSPHGYLRQFQERAGGTDAATQQFGEIGKFFVDPARQRGGVGKLLFERAKSFTRGRGLTALLAVVSTSVKAIGFYERDGLEFLGTFDGVHGKNLVYADGGMGILHD